MREPQAAPRCLPLMRAKWLLALLPCVACAAQDEAAAREVLRTVYTLPECDGRALHDLIVRNGYRRVLDVGTGRGASALWMAMAAKQTGGKVVTVEMNPVIADSARENFRRSGLGELIELRVGDIRRELARMPGSFDMIFVDIGGTDAQAVFPDLYARLARGGAIAVHDILLGGGETGYVAFIRGRPGLRTTFDRTSPQGLAISIRE